MRIVPFKDLVVLPPVGFRGQVLPNEVGSLMDWLLVIDEAATQALWQRLQSGSKLGYLRFSL